MVDETYDIQRLVQESGVPRRTIYFYVQHGILPPPEGAGLAAYYTGDHLLRLQMIPVLRRGGLRLDDIRQRLAGMTADEMKRKLAEAAASAAAEVAAEPGAGAGHRPAPELPGLHPRGWQPGALWVQRQGFVHYALPDGVVVMVPDHLANGGDLRVQRLLEAAAQIYQTPNPLGPGNGKIVLDQAGDEDKNTK